MKGLASSAVPVPHVLEYCAPDVSVLGAPFLIMERAPGLALRTVSEVAALDGQARSAVFTEMVDVLGRITWRPPQTRWGLSTSADRGLNAEWQVRTWTRQLTVVGTRRLPRLEALSERLLASVPVDWGAAIVHGDFRLDNCLVADGRVTAVLDWEMSTLGHPLADVATFAVYHDGLADHPNPVVEAPGRLPGSPTIDYLLERYVGATGRDLSGLGWYLGLAWFQARSDPRGDPASDRDRDDTWCHHRRRRRSGAHCNGGRAQRVEREGLMVTVGAVVVDTTLIRVSGWSSRRRRRASAPRRTTEAVPGGEHKRAHRRAHGVRRPARSECCV